MKNENQHESNEDKSKPKFLRKRIKSFGYAFKGILLLFQTQIHARIHLIATVFVTILGFYFKISKTEWSIIALICTMVISSEAINTAIETIIDLVSPGHHVLAGRAKDLAAGAVLIIAVGAVIVGLIIFLPYFLNTFN